MSDAPFRLYYWPNIQGRGEFVRLALEDAGASYVDVARLPSGEGGGVPALLKRMHAPGDDLEPFAPPFLEMDGLLLAQTTNILRYLGPRLGLAPPDEGSRARADQLQLTLADLAAEVHDTHHPVATSLYYEDQKPEAARRAAGFVRERLAKFLGYFERVLVRAGGDAFFATGTTHVDLSTFQMIEGLRYAFPAAMARLEPNIPHLVALRDRVAARPRLAAYLASRRRLPFNENGLFRRYPELDAEPVAG